MSAVFPGKPQSRLHGLSSTRWGDLNLNAYVSGTCFTILNGARKIIQTIYDESDEHLVAISIDERSGKIATCTFSQVRVYKPLGAPQEHSLKWALDSSFGVADGDRGLQLVLSWGSFEELLVAGRSLSLFDTKARPACSWYEELPNAVKLASLSYDSAFVAAIGYHDRLVKVWRRLTYGAGEIRFDLTYIRLPNTILDLRWRRPIPIQQAAENVLYTLSMDACVRLWTASDMENGLQWKLRGILDVGKSLQSIDLVQDSWLACLIDGRDFFASVEKAVEQRMADGESTDNSTLDHLVAVVRRSPEIYIVFDGRGSMSAWAIDVSTSTGQDSRILKIAESWSERSDNLAGFLLSDCPSHIELRAYCDRVDGKLYFLLHSSDGRIGIFSAGVVQLFDPTIHSKRLSLNCVWCGHSSAIKKINRSTSGRAVVSRTRNGETIVWKSESQNQCKSSSPIPMLLRRCVVPEGGHILRLCLLCQGRFVVFLREKTISLWDCRSAQGRVLAHCPFSVVGKPLCLIILPRSHTAETTTAYIATVTSEQRGIVWEVTFPRFFEVPAATEGARIREFCGFELKAVEGLKYVLPVDPAGSVPATTGFLDVFSRDIAVSYTHTGRVDLWTARIDQNRSKIDWLSTSCTETGILEPSLASGSTLKKVALVNCARTQLTIWDIGGARLEFQKDFGSHNSVQDLDWTSTPDAQSILAVGFQHRVILLCQMRFDYLDKGPAWASIREITIRQMTPHPIGDSTWLADGHLLIGAGNQLFVYDRAQAHPDPAMTHMVWPHRKTDAWDLFEAAQHFNGPLPVFHPQFLSQCMLAGKIFIVRRILVGLYRKLKYLIPGESIDNYLGLDITDFYLSPTTRPGVRNQVNGAFLDQNYQTEEKDTFTEEIAAFVNDKLTHIRIPQLSGQHQIQLVDIVECVALVERQRRSMDENGARFMLFFRQHALRKGRSHEIQLSWREINWAYHSKSQDILLDFVSRQVHGHMLWEQAREIGIFMWLADGQTLTNYFEVIARNEYIKSETKDPTDCSLFYIALGKKNVLQGLWRMARWNKEQVATQRLLANNFDEPKWRTAALKNAYALLSKRRFEYAAAFFLLASDLEAAVETCLRQIHDLQLAIAITRVYEGDSGPVLQKLLEQEVLPMAAQQGNRWLASWAFWMLGRKDMAVRALVTPVHTLLKGSCCPDLHSRLYLADDPALVVLYSQLRQQTLQTLQGASKVTPRIEWEFVLQSAKLYDRMGCDLLGLELVRNWEFQSSRTSRLHMDMNSPMSLRRGSLVVNDLPRSEPQSSVSNTSSARANQFPATTPIPLEPDMASFLDSFGL